MASMRAPLTGTKRGDGRWMITVTLTDANGQKVRKPLYAPTQREVQEKAQRLLHSTGRTAHEKHTLTELIELYRSERFPLLPDGTIRQQRPALKRIESGLGSKDVREIKPTDVSRWMQSLSRDPRISGRTVQAYRNVLSVLYRYALEIAWAETNPALGTPLPFGVSAQPMKRPRLHPLDYRRLLEKETNPTLRDLWEFLGETGMRPSEALALKRDALFYSHDLYWAKGGMKTEAGVREVPIPDQLAHRLMERPDWLFPVEGGGRPMAYRRVEEYWGERMTTLEIDPMTNLYQLRKLAVSRWFANGLPDDLIKGLVGHTDPELTKEVYNRLGRERFMNSLFSGQYVGGMSARGEDEPPIKGF